MVRCLKWFPFAAIACLVLSLAFGYILVRPKPDGLNDRKHGGTGPEEYVVSVTFRAYDTSANLIQSLVTFPGESPQATIADTELRKRWTYGTTPTKISARAKDSRYGPEYVSVSVPVFNDKEYEAWLREDLPKQMKQLGADKDAIAKVTKSLRNRLTVSPHSIQYDYAFIFAPVRKQP